MATAVYPGSLDPITNGHLDVIRRASALFGELIVAIYDRPEKPLLFSVEERVEMAKKAVIDLPNVYVTSFSGLVVDFVRSAKAKVMVRGLRANSDFEREFEMALMNKSLAPDVELACLMTSLQYQFLSASVIKEVAKLGGCLEGMVPNHVAKALKDKFSTTPLEVAKDTPSH